MNETDKSIGELTDESLIALTANGNRRALGELYRRYCGKVRTVIANFDRSIPQVDLDEISHEVFVDLVEASKRYDERSRFKAWLFSIAVRKSRTWKRNTWLRDRILKDNRQDYTATMHKKEASVQLQYDRRQAIEQIFERLPESQRQVIWLHAAEGFTGEEIAQIMRVRVNTVWTRLFRARQSVLKTMDELDISTSGWTEAK